MLLKDFILMKIFFRNCIFSWMVVYPGYIQRRCVVGIGGMLPSVISPILLGS